MFFFVNSWSWWPSFCSIQSLQSRTTIPCWTRSEISLMSSPGLSAQLWPSCSLGFEKSHSPLSDLFAVTLLKFHVGSVYLCFTAFVQESRRPASQPGLFQDADPVLWLFLRLAHPSKDTCRHHPPAQGSSWLGSQSKARPFVGAFWELWLWSTPALSHWTVSSCGRRGPEPDLRADLWSIRLDCAPLNTDADWKWETDILCFSDL